MWLRKCLLWHHTSAYGAFVWVPEMSVPHVLPRSAHLGTHRQETQVGGHECTTARHEIYTGQHAERGGDRRHEVAPPYPPPRTTLVPPPRTPPRTSPCAPPPPYLPPVPPRTCPPYPPPPVPPPRIPPVTVRRLASLDKELASPDAGPAHTRPLRLQHSCGGYRPRVVCTTLCVHCPLCVPPSVCTALPVAP